MMNLYCKIDRGPEDPTEDHGEGLFPEVESEEDDD